MSYSEQWYVNAIIERIGDEDHFQDVLHQFLDNHVSNSSIQENIEIINDFAGGIYEAQQGYIDNFGEFTFNSKENFYAKLAFYSLYEVIYPLMMKNIEDDNASNTSTEEEDNDNDEE